MRRFKVNQTAPNGDCLICGKPAYAPFRVYHTRGKVISGCIGEAHTGRLIVPSESNSWHYRKEAKELRRKLQWCEV